MTLTLPARDGISASRSATTWAASAVVAAPEPVTWTLLDHDRHCLGGRRRRRRRRGQRRRRSWRQGRRLGADVRRRGRRRAEVAPPGDRLRVGDVEASSADPLPSDRIDALGVTRRDAVRVLANVGSDVGVGTRIVAVVRGQAPLIIREASTVFGRRIVVAQRVAASRSRRRTFPPPPTRPAGGRPRGSCRGRERAPSRPCLAPRAAALGKVLGVLRRHARRLGPEPRGRVLDLRQHEALVRVGGGEHALELLPARGHAAAGDVRRELVARILRDGNGPPRLGAARRDLVLAQQAAVASRAGAREQPRRERERLDPPCPRRA